MNQIMSFVIIRFCNHDQVKNLNKGMFRLLYLYFLKMKYKILPHINPLFLSDILSFLDKEPLIRLTYISPHLLFDH